MEATTLNLLSQITEADAIFVVSGFLGMVFHYMKKKTKKQTKASMLGWFGKDNGAASMTTLGAFAMACIAALNSGVITPEMNVYAVMYAGLTTGFAIDSGFNSDKETAVKKVSKAKSAE